MSFFNGTVVYTTKLPVGVTVEIGGYIYEGVTEQFIRKVIFHEQEAI